MNLSDNHIILFDGVCNLCNGFVQVVIRNDKKHKFKFASLQSEYAASLPELKGKIGNSLSTVVLIQGNQYYFKSTAALKIARHLGFPLSLAYVFVIVPTPVRDAVYNWVASNRYRWFGKRNECWIPTPELSNRFLN
jgi:predicted DCC family thiol-disulfide oxidoreductase YuxK